MLNMLKTTRTHLITSQKTRVVKSEDVVTHLHQQLSAEGVVVVVREDLRQLAKGAETLPVSE